MMPQSISLAILQLQAEEFAKQCNYHDAECHVCRGGDDTIHDHCCAFCTEYPMCERPEMCPGLQKIREE